MAQTGQRLHQLLQRLAKDGLDDATLERLRSVALARQNWMAQGNSALADTYWSSLGSYEEGRFADPAPELRKIHTAQLDAALNLLLKQPSYLRVEQPLLSTTGLYVVGAVAVLILLLALVGLVSLLRRR